MNTYSDIQQNDYTECNKNKGMRHMTAFIRQSSLSILLLLCLLGHNSAFSHGAAKADWIHVGGNVDFEGIPLCALVLINGVSQFSCDGNGRYDMEVPVDANGMITVQVFVDGFAPFNQIVTPDQAAAYPVAMVQDQGSPSLDVGATYEPSATEGRLVVSGSITIGGAPVCALVLANGVSMFSCGGAGQYSLDVPLDQDGNVTLMVFAAGFKPYKVITDVENAATNQDTIAIAAFNIQVFGNTKIGKPEVVAELAEIVRKYDIVAVQEIKNIEQTVPYAFLEAINQSGNYALVLGQRGGLQPDDANFKEQYAFYYNLDTIELMTDYGLFPDGDSDLFQREPLVSRFKVLGSDFTFVLITVHTSPSVAVAEIKSLHEVFQWAQVLRPLEYFVQ